LTFTQFRDRVGTNDVDSDGKPAPAYEVDFVEQIDSQQTQAKVTQALTELPSRQRRAIELVHFQGMTYVKAAREMETSRKAVKSLLGRGKQSLGEVLEEHYSSRFA
jgi:RNA polymerase sigma-70 factor (ECF subfamily)